MPQLPATSHHAALRLSSLRQILSAFAYAKQMPVGVPNVHLADMPRHVGRGESDIQPSGNALSMDLINVVHPNRHPCALVGLFISMAQT
jgi:hypothetical protein